MFVDIIPVAEEGQVLQGHVRRASRVRPSAVRHRQREGRGEEEEGSEEEGGMRRKRWRQYNDVLDGNVYTIRLSIRIDFKWLSTSGGYPLAVQQT